MATKNNTNYFSHDCNARNDERLMKIRAEFGREGYGVYFAIVEILSEATDYKMSLDSIEVITLLYHLNNDVITRLFSLGLLIKDDKYFRSESLLKRMEIKDKKKDKLSKAGKKGMDKRRGEQGSNNDVITSKVKESKVKEKKGNKTQEEIQQTNERKQKMRAVETKGQFLVKERNKITGRNDLMDKKTKEGFYNFIQEVDTQDFAKRTEVFTKAVELIETHKIDRFIFQQIQNYSIGNFISNINLFANDIPFLFKSIVNSEYKNKVLRMVSDKKPEPKKEEPKEEKPSIPADPEEVRKTMERLRGTLSGKK